MVLSVSYISPSTRNILWGKAAGRCQYCNRPLYFDDLTKWEFNSSYIAHIIADKPTGPRGHPTESERLKSDLANLMLLCDQHHRLIDIVDISGHPVELLTKMKSEHEERVTIQTTSKDHSSHVVLYGAKIGLHDSPLTWLHAHEAMRPEMYPAESKPIEIGLQNSAAGDSEKAYWEIERTNLNRNFDRLIRRQITDGHITHLSVFALGPQPLLIELGRLISDLRPANIYQLQREPTQTWRWSHDRDDLDYTLTSSVEQRANVALNISLSGTIDNSRIQAVLGSDTSIWTITIAKPHNDFLKSPRYLSRFRAVVRRAFEDIKRVHGQDTILNIFPAMPVSAAIEFGRVWQPKADLEMTIFDQNRNCGGFVETLNIQNRDFS